MMWADGYCIHEAVLAESECNEIISAISPGDALPFKAGVRSLMRNPAIEKLANDFRLLEITRSIAGAALVPYKATLFNKTGKANWLVAWHQDTALPVEFAVKESGWGPFRLKDNVLFGHAPTEALQKIVALRIHLDASTSSNGPLRVIPTTHTKRFRNDAEFQSTINVGPQIELTVGKGGVIAMSPLLIHASSKCTNDDPRRVLHIEYSEALDLGRGVRLAVA